MIAPSEFLKYLMIFGVPFGGGGGGGVTASEVQQFAFNFSPSAGANDAFIVTLDPEVTTLTDGLIVSMSSGALTNLTAAPTLQVNALAAKDIVLWSGAVAPGDIEPGGSYLFVYDAANDNFQLINPSISTANAFFVQDNAYNTGIDTGAANAYDVTLLINPPMPFSAGFTIYLQVGAGNTNTGASTITVNGNTDPIVNPDGSSLAASSLIEGRMYLLIYDTNYAAWVVTNSYNGVFNTLAFNPTTGGVVGTTTNDNADVGIVGRFASSQVTVPVTSGVTTNITSLPLPAGDWEVWGGCATIPAGGATVSIFQGWVNGESAAAPDLPKRFLFRGSVSSSVAFPVVRRRFSLPSASTVYLSTNVTYSSGTMGVEGVMYARRAR